MNVKDYIQKVFNIKFLKPPPKDTFTTIYEFYKSRITHVKYSPFGEPVEIGMVLYDENNHEKYWTIGCEKLNFKPFNRQYIDVKIVKNDRTGKESLQIIPNIPEPLTPEDLALIEKFYGKCKKD